MQDQLFLEISYPAMFLLSITREIITINDKEIDVLTGKIKREGPGSLNVKKSNAKQGSRGSIFLQAGHCNLGNGVGVEIVGGNRSDSYSFGGRVSIRGGFK